MLIIGEKSFTKNNKIPDIIKNTPKDMQRFIKFIGLTLLASRMFPTAPQKKQKIIEQDIIRITGIALRNSKPNQYFIITSVKINN